MQPPDNLQQRLSKSLGGIDRAAADLHELGEGAARRGIRVALEALS